MISFDFILHLASRRSIRSKGDLRLYVARMTGYISAMTMAITAVQSWHQDPVSLVGLMVGAGAISAVLALPITWEFGQMYLDLWNATQTLRELASKDQQTGLLNNRSFIAAVETRLAAGRKVALFVGDLDRFKAVNDQYGHLTGDEMIARVGTTLRDLFGDSVVLGRMGGEEYAVMIDSPFADPAAARAHVHALAEEMRRRVADIAVSTERGAVRPTISIGIAWSRPEAPFSDLYSRADKALYVAKAGGRDRVVGDDEIEIFDPEVTLARRQDLFWREPLCETAAVA